MAQVMNENKPREGQQQGVNIHILVRKKVTYYLKKNLEVATSSTRIIEPPENY